MVSMDEVPLEAPEGISVPAEGGVELIPDPVPVDDTIKKMKVEDIRFALQARGMSRNGIKSVLID